jgi:glucose-1-phosphate thymidylyltransferase
VNDYMPLHMFELLGPGADFGAHFTYEIQDKAGGFAQVLGLVEGFADEEDVVVGVS